MARISERSNPDISISRGSFKHLKFKRIHWINYISLTISIIALLKSYNII